MDKQLFAKGLEDLWCSECLQNCPHEMWGVLKKSTRIYKENKWVLVMPVTMNTVCLLCGTHVAADKKNPIEIDLKDNEWRMYKDD